MGKRILTYFELPIEDASKWEFKDYMLFVLESLYSTVFPFVAGMLLISKKQFIWIFMLILPIYFKFKIDSKKTKKKRIYVK